jgi:hypothetical protein
VALQRKRRQAVIEVNGQPKLTRKYLRFAKDLRGAEDATTRQSLYMTHRTDEKAAAADRGP